MTTQTTQTTTQSTTTVTTTPTSTPTTTLAPVTPGQVLFLDKTCPCNNRNLKIKQKKISSSGKHIREMYTPLSPTLFL